MAIRFSKKALDNISQNSDIHSLTKIRATWSYIGLGFIAIITFVVIFWGCLGRITESIKTPGITLLSDGVTPLTSQSSGTLKYLNIEPGSEVSIGQVVGQIYSPQLISDYTKAETEYRSLYAEVDALVNEYKKNIEFLLSQETRKKELLDSVDKEIDETKERIIETLTKSEPNFNKIDQFKLEYFQTLDSVLQTHYAHLDLLLQGIETESNSQRLIWEAKEKLNILEHQLEEKRRIKKIHEFLFRESYWITAGNTGKISEVFKETGSYIENGELIALIASNPEDGIYLVAYVPIEQGKKIKSGMRAFFLPSGESSTKNGYVRAVVRKVSEIPVNFESISAELLNQSLAKKIVGNDVMSRVELELIPDLKNPTGYSWTSKSNHSKRLINGVYGEVIINIDYRSPISYILPVIRDIFSTGDKE